jgi:hypothetical protein
MERSSSGSGRSKAGSASSTVAHHGDDESSDLAENKILEREPPVYPSDRQPCGHDESHFTDFHQSSDLAENKSLEREPPVHPSDRQPCGHDESHYSDFHRSKSSESNFEGASDREARCEQAILRRISGSCTREEAEDPALGTRSREA